MPKNQVRETKSVRQRSETIRWESYLAYGKQKTQLKRDGRLTEEIPLGDRFVFSVDGDWVAVVQRQECRDLLRNRILRITIGELMSVEEFGRWTIENSVNSPNRQLVNTSSAIEPTSGGTDWLANVSGALAPWLKNSHLPILLWVMVAGAIGLLAVGYNYQGQVNLKMETDGTKVNGEFTIDGRQSE